MKAIEIIDAYDSLLNQLQADIKKSNYKIQFFLDELNLKRSFFYKKLKEKRFTPEELRIISKRLYPEDSNYSQEEIEIISKLIKQSKEDYKNGDYQDWNTILEATKKKYGL